MGERRSACRDLVGKPEREREGEIPLGKLKRRSGSIKLVLKQEEGRDWMNLAYDRDKWQSLVNTQ